MSKVKSKLGLRGVFISTLCVLLILPLLVCMFTVDVKGQDILSVGTEVELRTAISNVAAGVPVIITLNREIGLSGSTLTIPANKDITLRSIGNVDLELFGAAGLSTITIENRGKLTLAGITVTHVSGATGMGVAVNSGGTLFMSGGKISGNSGHGVTNNGNFTISSGRISNNGDYGVVITGSGSNFTMTGGEISGNNNGVYLANGAFNMTAGKISGSIANNGVYVVSGTFTMTNGEISGGVNARGVDNSGTFIMTGGTISGHNRNFNGGGVYNTGTFTMSGGTISNNRVIGNYNGGGVWSSGTFTMTGGEISKNTAINGGGVYISGGVFNLHGGKIIGNTASNNGGGVWVTDTFTNFNRLIIRSGVEFSDNRAYAAYNRASDHDATYRAYVADNVKWTAPFTQGYNNFDISYVYGTSITTFAVTVHDSYATPSGAGSHPVRSSVTVNAGTRNGYNFARWTVNSGGITLANSATATFTMPANDVVVTANWNAIQYSISYTLNSGTASGNPTAYNADNAYTINNPTRTGYNFIGWTVRYANGTEFAGQIGYTIPRGSYGNIVFTANWGSPNQYPIAYVLNGGTNAANPTSYTVAELPRTISNPTRAGYAFAGWTVTYSNGWSPVTYPTTSYSIPSGATGLVTLTANWSPFQYSISYTLNSGTITGNLPSSYNAENPTAIPNPTRTGYNFIGWTVTYANNTQFNGQISYTIPRGSYGNVALTANWGSPNQYPVSYVLNGGTNAANNPTSYNIADLPRSISNPTRTGYTFQGWTIKYNDGRADVTYPTASYSIPSGVTGQIILTANWTPIQYTITYTLNSGTVSGNPTTYNIENSVTINNPIRTGYNFMGWTVTYANNTEFTGRIGYTIPRGSYGNVVLVANWGSPNQHAISYVLNGGTNAVNNPATYTIADLPQVINAPTRTGYNFRGWTVAYTDGRTDITTPTVSYSIPSGVTGQITLTANWTPIQYTITYALSSGTNAAGNPTVYNVENLPLTISNPTRANYDFSGWTVRYANGTEVTGQISYRIPIGTTGNIGLTANWGAPSTGDSSGSSNGGGSGGSGQSGSGDNTKYSPNPSDNLQFSADDEQTGTNDDGKSRADNGWQFSIGGYSLKDLVTICMGPIVAFYYWISGLIINLLSSWI